MQPDKRFTVQVFLQRFHQKQGNVFSPAGKNADVVLQRFYVKNIVEKYLLIPLFSSFHSQFSILNYLRALLRIRCLGAIATNLFCLISFSVVGIFKTCIYGIYIPS